MSGLINLQQVLSNITSVEKVQQVQQHHAQEEQSRLISQNRKTSKNKGKKIEDVLPSDKVDISVKYGPHNKEDESERREKEEKDERERDETDDKVSHIDIRV